MTEKKRDISKAAVALLMKELVYFLSGLLLLGAAWELIFPGLFLLYFNVALVAGLWLVAVLAGLLYVRR